MIEPTVADLAIRDLAALIRDVDGDNTLAPRILGVKIATALSLHHAGCFDKAVTIVEFVERTNPDKRMDAGRLAELIITEFELDKES
jgi:hypothetical protein